jgi:mannose-1-phosphate guanylyltransferase/phosphomannomutase
MKAVILAGGYGVRLRPLTYTRPKPMLPLAGKPVLHHIIDFLAENGFDDIVVTSNYLREQIEAYFGTGNKFGVRLSYPIEPEPLGTAGCVKNIEEILRDETFVVIQGDNITNIDLNKALETHQESKGLATILLVKVDNASEFGIAKLNGRSNITKFVEKPKTKEKFNNLANTGLYILEPQVLDYIPTAGSFDFSKDLFPRLMNAGERLMGYEARGTWFDTGRIEDYLSANRWMLNRLKKRGEEASIMECEAVMRGPVFVGKDVEIESGVKIYGPTIIGDNCHIKHDATIVSPTTIGPNVETGREAKIRGSIIYENTEIGNQSRLAHCVVGENCEIGSRTTLRQGAVIGAACQIGSGTTITANAKIWPLTIVEKNSIIQGLMK